jgi:hypothetical protein
MATSKKSAKKSVAKKSTTKFVAPVAPDDYRTDEYQAGDKPRDLPDGVDTSTAPTGGKTTPTPKKSVAKKSTTPVAKKVTKATAKKSAAPNPLHEKLIALMARKDGATISDFQTVDGFNIPSMAAMRIAERHGYQVSASKKPGERTIYKAVKRAAQ